MRLHSMSEEISRGRHGLHSEMILASLPHDLTEPERKRALYERTCGEPLPEACWDRLRSA